MPLTIIKGDVVLETKPMFTKEGNPEMAEIEKTNEVEVPDEPANVGEAVEVTNPIEPVVVYSDAPGAGPPGAPNGPAEEPETEGKAQAKPAATKAQTGPKATK